MLSPSEFVMRWNEFLASEQELLEWKEFELLKARPEDLEDKELPATTKQFLIEAGLPRSVEPYIGFQEIENGLRRIWEVYSPYSWKEEEKQPLEHYVLLGADEDGDPICIDERNGGQIVVLAHDDYFNFWKFVNSSVSQLAECVLAYNSGSRQELKTLLERIDSQAIQPGTFWHSELKLEN